MELNWLEAARFWTKVEVKDVKQCWVWRGACFANGYGAYGRDGRNRGAHRWAYELAYGPIPTGMEVCHHCDNKPCCNPFHLFVGDQQANMSDKTAKLRQTHGPQVNTAKLTEKQVLEIRAKYATGTISSSQLAEHYGVSRHCIQRIIHRKNWAWL